MVQLQSILFPDSHVCQVEELYFHRYNQIQETERIDFDGYFNLFYIEKRKKYTQIEELSLQLTLYGYKELILVHDGTDIKTLTLSSTERRSYSVEFPYENVNTGAFWFALIRAPSIDEPFISGSYITEKMWNPVHIGIDICTFRREAYVQRNLQQLKERILDNRELEVSEHVTVYVIDNGKTMSHIDTIKELQNTSEGKIHILENKNAGGAGGFTRGMMEVLQAKKRKEAPFTHVLLMDDDAVVEPDALVRIYGFLVTVREEWKNITLGGTMLREDFPYMLFCAGEWWKNGTIVRPEMNLDIRDREMATTQYLTETGNETERYSGWWCCCYSLETVREDNLPIPLFIHYDDIEFGVRNKNQGIVFLNGVGVWHKGFELLFSGANMYYDTRNNLMQIALHQKKGKKQCAARFYLKMLTVATIRMRYKDAELIYRGLRDFLKGPEWLHEQEPEQLNNEIRGLTYQMKILEGWKDELTEDEVLALQRQIAARMERFSLEEIIKKKTVKKKATLLHYLTLNGWLLPTDSEKITLTLSTDSPFSTFRKRKIACYEPVSGRMFLTQKSYKKFLRLVTIYWKSFWLFLFKLGPAIRDYKEHMSSVTNQRRWEEYLEEK